MGKVNTFSSGDSETLINCGVRKKWSFFRSLKMRFLLVVAALFCCSGLCAADDWKKSIEPGIELIRARKWSEADAFFQKLLKSKDKTHAKELNYWSSYAWQGKKVVNHDKFLKRDLGKNAVIFVPDDVKTINGAMSLTVPGDTVKLRPGTYFEYVSLAKGVTLSGTDRDKCIIKLIKNYPCAFVSLYRDNVCVENLTIDGSGHDSKVQGLPVTCKIKDGKVITDSSLLAKSLKMPEGSTLLKVQGFDPRYINYLVSNFKKGCTLNTEWLLKSGERKTIQVIPAISANTLFPVGVVSVQAWCRVSNCLMKNLSCGIVSVGEKAHLDAEENVISSCKLGINVLFGGSASIKDNICEKSPNGIVVFDKANVIINDNSISGASQDGIKVGVDSIAYIYNNLCLKCNYGITLLLSSSGIIQKNICGENNVGISVQSNSSANLMENKCSGNQGKPGYGILVYINSRAECYKNTCNKNFLGIVYQIKSSGNVRGNICNDNTNSGILFYDRCFGAVTKNTCNNNKICGISFKKSSAGRADQNKIIGNTIGFLRLDSQEVTVGENFSK